MSKSTIGGVIGGIIGFYVGGPTGAQIGFMIGSGIGASFDTIQGRKVGEMSSPRAQEGEPIPLVFGTARVTGRLMSCGKPSIVEEGGKGGPQVVNETAYLSYSILVCESSDLRDSTIGGILMVIQNNKIVYDVRPNPAISGADSAKWKANKVFYFGGEGQGVDPTEQMIHGVGNVPAYRGLCRMVVTDEDVTQHGGGIPTYEFVTSQCGVEEGSFAEVARFIGAGVTPVGEIATTRTLDQFAIVLGTDDANVGSTETSAVLDVAVSGARVYALVSGGGPAAIYEAARSNLTSWANVAAPSLGAGIHRITAAAGAVFVTSGTVLSKWDGVTLTTTDFGTTLTGAAGDGDVLLVIGLYGNVWKSTDGGDTFAIAETFTGWNLYSIAYNGLRFVVAGSIGALIGFGYSDDAGESWVSSSFDPGIALQPHGLIWCGESRWMMSLTGNVAANYFFASADNAVSFTAVTLPEDIKYAYPGSIAHDAAGGLTVVIGTNASDQRRCYSSSDLTVWADVDLSDTASRSIFSLYPTYVGYVPPEGAIELPDAPGHYYDPSTGGTSGPTTVIADTCPPITLQEIIDKLDARAGIPTANRDSDAVADIVVPGYAIDSFMTVAEAKEVLRPIYRFACPEYDDKIRYELFGRDTDFVVDPDDLIVTGEPSEKSVRGQTVEFPRRLHVQYVDPALGYKPMKQTDERTSPDILVKGELVMGANVTLEADTAKQAAVVGLKVAWTEREDMGKEIALPIDYFAKTIPSHTYTLEGRRFRITDMRLSAGAIYLTSVYDRKSAFFSNAVGTVGPRPTAPGSQVRGPTISAVMNVPVLRDVDDKAGIYWGACGPMSGWRGAQLQISRDGGATWVNGPSVDAPAVMGELTATLPSADRYAQDNTNTLSLTLYRSETLDSTDQLGLLNERNAFAILYPNNTVEVCQFQTATEIADRQWELTGLIRGRLDTAVGEHLAGAVFVLLNDAVRFVAIRPDDVGKTLKFRAISVGTDPDAAEVQDVTFTTIESLREWQPYNVVVTADGLGGYCVEWIGRARLGSSRTPVHSQWFDGYRVTFTIGTLTYDVDTTAQAVCVDAATMADAFPLGYGWPQVTVRARSRVATNDDDFDSPPGAPAPTEANYPATIVGGPSDGYVGEPLFDYIGPNGYGDFKAYGGLWEEYFTGEIVGNLTAQSFRPGMGVVRGVPLTAETRSAATEMFVSGPLVTGGPFLITDSVTILAKPTYSLMDEASAVPIPVVAGTTLPRTTRKFNGSGTMRSRAGFNSGKPRMEVVIAGLSGGMSMGIGVFAGGANSAFWPGVAGHYVRAVGNGTFAVECDGATGAIKVLDSVGATVATSTLGLTHSFDGMYRFAFTTLTACPGATIHINMGNESWLITPSSGYGGLPNEPMIVPCGFDAVVATANGTRLQGELSLTDATSTPSSDRLNYAYAAFGKSTGKWRIGMAHNNTDGRLGFCKSGHTGWLGGSGTGDSIGFTDTRSPDGYVIETSFGGVHNRIVLPPFYYYSNPLVRFAFDVDAGTLEIWVKVEVTTGDPTAVYELLATLTGVPAGTWLPAMNGRGNLTPEIAGPATYDDWTETY